MKITTIQYFAIGFILLVFCPEKSPAQNRKKNIETDICNRILNFQFHYTYELPQADLSSRFGTIHNAGFGGLMKSKTNWLCGFDVSYQFGIELNENVTQSILINLTNSTGTISNGSGTPGTYYLGMRGLNSFIKGGKLFNLTKNSPNSGIALMGGAGFLTHQISITTPQNNIPTLTDDLKKGYDRLTMGFALTQFVGYFFQGKNRMTNFYVGVDIIEAFTKSTRGFNYDMMQPDNDRRLDIVIGPRFCWMIPVYLASKNQDEFYYK